MNCVSARVQAHHRLCSEHAANSITSPERSMTVADAAGIAVKNLVLVGFANIEIVSVFVDVRR